jgi:hypothetical protein
MKLSRLLLVASLLAAGAAAAWAAGSGANFSNPDGSSAPLRIIGIWDGIAGPPYNGIPISPANPLPAVESPGAVTIAQTIVTLTAGTSATLIAANTSRKYLCWMNVGAAPMTVAPGAVTVVAGQGMNYDPGSSPINQGGAFCQESISVSRQAFSAVSTAGTTVAVWEGQ